MDLTRKRLERGYSPRPTNPQPRRRGEFVIAENTDFAGTSSCKWRCGTSLHSGLHSCSNLHERERDTVPRSNLLVRLALLGVIASSPADSQIGKKAELALNPARPYVYVEFDHAGQREPVEDGEPTEGLWLRLVNNSNFTINVETMDTATKSKLVLVPDTISTIQQKIPRSGLLPKRMPVGYASGLGTVQAIAPGKYLVFSVPSNHVSQYWYLQVPFEFDVPRTQMHEQPISYVSFRWTDLPKGSSSDHEKR